MFTINIYLKLGLIALFLLGGIALSFVWGFGYASPFIIIGLGLLASYIFLGTVQSAAQKMQFTDFDGANKRLNMTLNPKWLYSTNRAFYYIIKGSIAANAGDTETAEKLFTIAQSLKLPSDNERGMVLLQLANINAQKGRWTQAKAQFKDLKAMKITEPQLKAQVDQFAKAMNQQGQMKHMRTGQGRMAGGKRRRPKMR